MTNEHGIKCPTDWDKSPSHYKWIAIDSDGEIWAYASKPKISGSPRWQAVDFRFWFRYQTDPPADFKKCLWERPETQSK